MANFYKKSQFVGGAQQKKAQSARMAWQEKLRQSGRSMIEMLGVLAIIGILSLGSIAAYSAAMFKYQLNQHLESFSLLLNNAIALLPNLQRDYGKGTSGFINKFFADTSMLPAGMYYNPQSNAITDVFKNQLSIAYQNLRQARETSEYYIYITIDRDNDKISSRAKAICRNVLIAAKENAANIHAVEMRSGSENSNGSYSASSLVGGTYGFNDNRKRLVDAGLTDFEEVCSSCSSQRYCSIVLWIDLVIYN